jgi:circadian clock protein KaiC
MGSEAEMKKVSTVQRKSSRTAATKSLRKAPTGIRGLDEILLGGLPRGRVTLVGGGPGTGKTLLGLELLYRRALAGEPGVFVTFEESAQALRANVQGLGWTLEPLEKAGKLYLLEARVSPEATVSGEFNLKALLVVLEGQARAMGARLLVIDALDVLLRLFSDRQREASELFLLHGWLVEHGMTAVLTVKLASGAAASRYDFLEYLADCVLHLDQRVTEQVSTRRLRVVKYRGSGFGRNEYPYTIDEEGLVVVPVSSGARDYEALGSFITSGHKVLDQVLGGGYRRSSTVLIAGANGTGKTTMLCTFARSATTRREKVLYLDYEESAEELLEGMLGLGIDLRPALDKGVLKLISSAPEADGVEEHLVRALKTIDAFQPRHVLVDAVSAFTRMGSEHSAFDFLLRLMNGLKEHRITGLFGLQTSLSEWAQEVGRIRIGSLLDAIVVLRYVDSGTEVNRALLVMKARGAFHSNQYWGYRLTDHGMELASPELPRPSTRRVGS